MAKTFKDFHHELKEHDQAHNLASEYHDEQAEVAMNTAKAHTILAAQAKDPGIKDQHLAIAKKASDDFVHHYHAAEKARVAERHDDPIHESGSMDMVRGDHVTGPTGKVGRVVNVSGDRSTVDVRYPNRSGTGYKDETHEIKDVKKH
jgi:hypothetical protein